MLKITNLVKDYRSGFFRKNVRVLYDVSFSVARGEIYGFVGPNGAGKTTTFKVILGFASITSGFVSIMGGSVDDVEIKSKIGYLPENPYFYDYLTGEELLKYFGQLHGVSGKVLNVRIDELLEKVDMVHARNLQLRNYSKGMLQRIGLAQALINDADFLIFDEPMSGLDPIGQREIKDLILEQNKLGKTILMSSHILANVEALCDRVGLIVKGRVVKEGRLEDLLREIHTDYEMFLETTDESEKRYFEGMDVAFERRAGTLVVRFKEDLKAEAIHKAVNNNANIVSIEPMRKSLESLFLEETLKS